MTSQDLIFLANEILMGKICFAFSFGIKCFLVNNAGGSFAKFLQKRLNEPASKVFE